MEMSHIASKLKTLKLEFFDDMFVHLVLRSLLVKPKKIQFSKQG